MNPAYIALLNEGLSHHQAGRYPQAANIYNGLLNAFPLEENVCLFLSDIYLRQEHSGLATHILWNMLRECPLNHQAWHLLGVAYRKENKFDQALEAWNKSIEIGGESVEVCSNLAGIYSDRAMPKEALPWLDKALKLDPENYHALWSKALALLTLRQWDEGWKLYDSRFKLETWSSRPKVDAPIWDGNPVGHLYIHGEQGIGDEIMFASCLPFVRAGKVTLEVNERVVGVMRSTWPDFEVVETETPGDYDAKIPIGSLPRLFGFNPSPYLKPRQDRVEFYRSELQKLGPGPYVAVAWSGGSKQTRALDRSMSLIDLAPVLKRFTCISAQYSHIEPRFAEIIRQEREQNGLLEINHESTGADIHEQAALFKAVDAVVTVQQTAVHVAGGVGAKCHALISDCPHWRYGAEGDAMPWYGSVKLHRKRGQWKPLVEEVTEELNADFRNLPRAEQRAA